MSEGALLSSHERGQGENPRREPLGMTCLHSHLWALYRCHSSRAHLPSPSYSTDLILHACSESALLGLHVWLELQSLCLPTSGQEYLVLPVCQHCILMQRGEFRGILGLNCSPILSTSETVSLLPQLPDWCHHWGQPGLGGSGLGPASSACAKVPLYRFRGSVEQEKTFLTWNPTGLNQIPASALTDWRVLDKLLLTEPQVFLCEKAL